MPRLWIRLQGFLPGWCWSPSVPWNAGSGAYRGKGYWAYPEKQFGNRMLHRPLQPLQASVCSWVPWFSQSDFIQTDPEIFPRSLQQSQVDDLLEFWNEIRCIEILWINATFSDYYMFIAQYVHQSTADILLTFTRILTCCKVTELTLCVLVWRPQRFAPRSPQSELPCDGQKSTWSKHESSNCKDLKIGFQLWIFV